MNSSFDLVRTAVPVRQLALCLLLCAGSVMAEPTTGAVGEDGSVWTKSNGVSRSVVMGAPAVAGVPTLNVAIIASASTNITDPFFTDPQNRINGSGLFASVTVINAGTTTPTALDLQAFDAVLVWSNFSFDDAVTLGDRLADYVDNGGGVVVAVFANTSGTVGKSLAGRWSVAAYDVVSVGGGTTSGVAATLGTVNDPAHATMTGVVSFNGGTSSFRPTDTSLIASGAVIAEWSDGSTLVAAREDTVGARADLGFYPPSDIVLAGFWDPTTDGDLLLSNALLYAAQRTPLTLGDSDDDGDVDADDNAAFALCVDGDSNVLATAGCIVFDFDGDKNVDCDDWFVMRTLSMDFVPCPATCAGVAPAASSWGLAILALAIAVAGTIGLGRRAWA